MLDLFGAFVSCISSKEILSVQEQFEHVEGPMKELTVSTRRGRETEASRSLKDFLQYDEAAFLPQQYITLTVEVQFSNICERNQRLNIYIREQFPWMNIVWTDEVHTQMNDEQHPLMINEIVDWPA